MKKIALLSTVILMTLISTVSAQLNLYEQIEKNGPELEYVSFYHVREGKTPGTFIAGEGDNAGKITIARAKNGVKTGIDIGRRGRSLLYRSKEAKGYPNVSYIYDKDNNKGTIAVGDYVMDLVGISKDGKSFKKIKTIFVRKQVKSKKKATSKKKKSSFFSRMKKLASTAAASSGSKGGGSLEAKKVNSENLRKIATDYLIAMKVKQDAYTLTSSDRNDLQKIQDIINGNKARGKKANKAYWQSEEGQRILKKGKTDYLHVFNNSGGTIYIIEEDGKTTSFFGPGRTNKYKCTTKIYYCIGCGSNNDPDYKGAFIGGGNKSYCGKKITLTKSH